jgi:hypothetical protein
LIATWRFSLGSGAMLNQLLGRLERHGTVVFPVQSGTGDEGAPDLP